MKHPAAAKSPPAALAVALAAALVLLALAHASWAKPRDPAHEITNEIICPCSCGEVLTGCTCETGISMKGFVETSLKQGKGKDQIMGALVSQYGEVIRGAPKPQGFNLIVWIAPFAATLAGMGIAFLILRRWVRQRAAAAGMSGGIETGRGGTPRSAEADLDELRARAEAELRRMRE